MKGGGKGGSKTKTQTVRQETTIPQWVRPYAEKNLALAGQGLDIMAGEIYNNANYPGLDPTYTQGFNELQGLLGNHGEIASNERRLIDTSKGRDPRNHVPAEAWAALTDTAGGKYTDNLWDSPGFQAAMDASRDRSRRDIGSVFGRGRGGMGGGLSRAAVGEASTNAFANQWGSLYGQERGNQMSAAQILANLGEGERNRAFQATQALPDYMTFRPQKRMDAGVNRIAQKDDKRMQYLMNLISLAQGGTPMQGLFGQTQTTTTPLYKNTGGQILGGLLSVGGILAGL